MTTTSTDEAPQRRERHELCRLFRALGPDAPTLDEGWATRHLAAHLVVREWNPVASAGIIVKPLASWHERAIEGALRKHRYEDLVDKVDGGPPLWWRPLDGVANLVEYVVHHEDVRRGSDGWEPRPEADVAHLEAPLWRGLRRSARLYGRKLKDVTVELRLPLSAPSGADGDRSPIRMGHGSTVVVVEGRPIELLLFVLGRQRAARVELSGPPPAVAALRVAALGL